MSSSVVFVWRQARRSTDGSAGQSRFRAALRTRSFGSSGGASAHGAIADPLIGRTRWMSPFAKGLIERNSAHAAPVLCPDAVIKLGSPPKAAMLSRTQWKAANWSFRPIFPGITLSPVVRNPGKGSFPLTVSGYCTYMVPSELRAPEAFRKWRCCPLDASAMQFAYNGLNSLLFRCSWHHAWHSCHADCIVIS